MSIEDDRREQIKALAAKEYPDVEQGEIDRLRMAEYEALAASWGLFDLPKMIESGGVKVQSALYTGGPHSGDD